MEESGTKLHISIVLKHFALFSQKLSECGRVSLYLHPLMMKKLVYISILSLLLLSSCRSKRVITVSLPQPVMQAGSTQLGDTIGLPARLRRCSPLTSLICVMSVASRRRGRGKETADKRKRHRCKKAIVQRGHKNHIENHPRRLGL